MSAATPEEKGLLPCRRDLFDVGSDSGRGGVPAYFNNSGRTPLSRAVHAAGLEALGLKVRPWRIGSQDAAIDAMRGLFARLIDAPVACITLAPSTSYAVSLAAQNLVET